MPLEKLERFTKKASDLPDKPQIQSSELKTQFDAAPEEVRVYLNKMIDALKSVSKGDSGANNIGVANIVGVDGNDVQSALESLKKIVDGVSVGEIKNTSLSVNQSLAPTGNNGSIEQLISWLANRIKTMTGSTNWYDPISKMATEATEFVTPNLLNGWQMNSPTYPPRFWKEGSTVHFELAIMNGSMGANTVIMYFPSGYRPANSILFDGHADGQTSRAIYHVRNDGELKLVRALSSNSLVILNGSFRAVN